MYSCKACGFSGRDAYNYDRHIASKRHSDILAGVVNKDDLEDIRVMTHQEQQDYIDNHIYYQEFNPAITKFFQRKKRAGIIKKILIDAGLLPQDNVCFLPLDIKKQKEKEEISNEYDTDDESDEKYERMNAVDYSSDEIKVIHEEFRDWMTYFLSFECKKVQSSLPNAKDAVKKRIIEELNAIDKKKQIEQEKEIRNAQRLEAIKKEIELKTQMMELKMMMKK